PVDGGYTAIISCDHVYKGSREPVVNSRQTPSASDAAQDTDAKLRRFNHSRQIEDIAPVTFAIAAIVPSVRRIVVADVVGIVQSAVAFVDAIIDTMRQRVISVDRHTPSGAALHGEEHAVVVAGSAIVQLSHIGVPF